MDPARWEKVSDYEWRVPPTGAMRVDAVIFADEELLRGMDDKVYDQAVNVAALPSIVGAAYAMPDAHWGYGFPIGGVAAFDADDGGVVSVGGVGFDISCGVRALHTGLGATDIEPAKSALADRLFKTVPTGLGSTGAIALDDDEMNAMLEGGARWAVKRGWGEAADLDRIEEHGTMAGARTDCISKQARKRQRREMGTLGSGNHYLEIQKVVKIYDADIARAFGIAEGEAVLSIHCGSRGLGHQVGTEYLREMVDAAAGFGLTLPDRELACAPLNSDLGRRYLGAMRAAINCAFANREIVTHLAREAFAAVLPEARLSLLYDVSHNTCKEEDHEIGGRTRRLFVHRKGATRAFGPGHAELPEDLRGAGQPVLIGGSMGTASYILAGTQTSMARAFGSACHGAGRTMSRTKARKTWSGRAVVDELAERGIVARSPSQRGVAEEAPGAYKDVSAVVEASARAGLAKRVARLEPMVCLKG
ncbi:MAG TPA: RtcB family protein [Alphaproteobacteria bacterium]|nr:RtcB family protein [Alphaproteobacteria bacterium]